MSPIILRTLFFIVLVKDGFGMESIVNYKEKLGVHKGVPIPIEKAGYMAFIRAYYNASIHFVCDGTIIDSRHILTAGQCVTVTTLRDGPQIVLDPEAFHILIGTSDSTNKYRDGEELTVVKVFLKEYTLKNDVAILRTHENIEYTDRIYPFRLPPGAYFVPDNGTQVFLDGWGENDGNSTDLLRAYVQIFLGDKCLRRGANPSFQFCTRSNIDAGPCYGDIGTPLMYRYGDEDRETMQIGFVSSVPFQCENTEHGLSVYTSVSANLPWITSVLVDLDEENMV